MTDQCDHLDSVQADLVPSSDGCEDCLAIGGRWVHLRMCQQCGHVGCCDSSPNRHATAHFHDTGHAGIVTDANPAGVRPGARCAGDGNGSTGAADGTVGVTHGHAVAFGAASRAVACATDDDRSCARAPDEAAAEDADPDVVDAAARQFNRGPQVFIGGNAPL